MKLTFNRIVSTLSLALIVTLGAVALSAVAQTDWTPPPGSPPGGNVPAPINAGSSGQYKAGALSIGQNTAPVNGNKLEVGGSAAISGSVAATNLLTPNGSSWMVNTGNGTTYALPGPATIIESATNGDIRFRVAPLGAADRDFSSSIKTPLVLTNAGGVVINDGSSVSPGKVLVAKDSIGTVGWGSGGSGSIKCPAFNSGSAVSSPAYAVAPAGWDRNFSGTWLFSDEGGGNDFAITCRNGMLTGYCAFLDEAPPTPALHRGRNNGVYTCE